MMLLQILKKKPLTSALFSFAFCLLVLPINEALWFTLPLEDRGAILYSHALKILFGICLFFVTWFTLHFVEKIRADDSFYKEWLKHSAIYGFLLILVLILIFPGYWSWDEFYVLQESKTYNLYSWQHIFTQMQYVFSIYIFPTTTTVTVIQLLTISLIVGYIVACVKTLITHNRYAYLAMFLPFITFPAIQGNFYTLRLNIYAYLLTLLCFKLYLLIRQPESYKKKRYATFIGLSLLVSLVAFWRSEGIIFLSLLPIIAYLLEIFPIAREKRKLSIASLSAALFLIIGSYAIVKGSQENTNYSLTATIMPLSTLIQDDLSVKNNEKEWQNIDRVIDTDVLARYPSYSEIPAYWFGKGLVRENYTKYLDKYYSSFVKIIIDNPETFLKNRVKTYLATNSMYPSDEYGSTLGIGWLTEYSLDGCSNIPAAICPAIQSFEKSILNSPLDPDFRKEILLILTLQAPGFDKFLPYVWNVTPILVFLVGLIGYAVSRKDYIWMSILTIPLIHALMIFVTAPAILFMYYFPAYLCGLSLTVLYCLSLYDSHTRLRKESI